MTESGHEEGGRKVGLERAIGLILNRIMDCRPHCGACCLAPSISSPIPGMPLGKPAGMPCGQLRADYRCALFGQPERPAVCISLQPSIEMCGTGREEAMALLTELERLTAPARTGRGGIQGINRAPP